MKERKKESKKIMYTYALYFQVWGVPKSCNNGRSSPGVVLARPLLFSFLPRMIFFSFFPILLKLCEQEEWNEEIAIGIPSYLDKVYTVCSTLFCSCICVQCSLVVVTKLLSTCQSLFFFGEFETRCFWHNEGHGRVCGPRLWWIIGPNRLALDDLSLGRRRRRRRRETGVYPDR